MVLARLKKNGRGRIVPSALPPREEGVLPATWRVREKEKAYAIIKNNSHIDIYLLPGEQGNGYCILAKMAPFR
jgi:hypothetical protein